MKSKHGSLAMYRLTYGFELTRFGTHQKVEPLKPKNRRWTHYKKKKRSRQVCLRGENYGWSQKHKKRCFLAWNVDRKTGIKFHSLECYSKPSSMHIYMRSTRICFKAWQRDTLLYPVCHSSPHCRISSKISHLIYINPDGLSDSFVYRFFSGKPLLYTQQFNQVHWQWNAC